MNALRNQAQLIGYVGNDPEITELEGGKKLAKFSLATNEIYNNAAGERTFSTEWHTIIAWDRQAEIAEKYVQKGKEIAVSGRELPIDLMTTMKVKRSVLQKFVALIYCF